MIIKYLTMLRPSQWLKNVMLFFPPFLTGQILLPGHFVLGLLPFAAFCMVSSSGYVFNDIMDRKRDINHPVKRFRPIAAGVVSITHAFLLLSLLLLAGLLLAVFISHQFFFLLLVYTAITILYSLKLKTIPVVDVFCIAAGFLIRLQSGGVLFNIQISSWLFLTVFLLAVFLSTGKRLSEFRTLGIMAGEHRTTLTCYPTGFLSGTLYMTAGAVLVTYSMYALNKQKLVYTVPLCLFGLLRYIFRVSSGQSGDPTESLIKDPVLLVVSLVWLLMVVWSIYK
ncbi:MAG: decaprenyl-phosphate phosphoribosyltransferase [Desulfuromonadaceae bacterium]|nr:decaprenyl-phosphate phosphoribosyltransferase [Desulfuromonadaceae bacterium]MDD2854098.1 decaprenyl-phosphate phosphoribosyltransferase [Desulfuromonadaceae bacterium]